MSLCIKSIATALPAHHLLQTDAAEVAKKVCAENDDHAGLLDVLYRQTHIERRYVVFKADMVHDIVHGSGQAPSIFAPRDGMQRGPTTQQRMERYHNEALPLAITAAAEALSEADVTAKELTHLVTVSCTGFAAPGVDIGLIKSLGMAPTVQRTHVGFMGCHGALNGLRVASALTQSVPNARVLLCAVELCSLHYYYGWNPKKMVGNALFADGAAALVGVKATENDGDEWRHAASGSCLFENSEYAMTWHVGDNGFDMMLSTRVPDLINKNLRPWLVQWLRENGLEIGDIASWAVHPGGPRILTSVEESLDLPADSTDVSREILTQCGNMSSPTVLFILDEMRRQKRPLPCVALGFGPGLVVEGAIFR